MTASLASVIRAHVEEDRGIWKVWVNDRDFGAIREALARVERRKFALDFSARIPRGCYRIEHD